jgi:hypothetical protein
MTVSDSTTLSDPDDLTGASARLPDVIKLDGLFHEVRSFESLGLSLRIFGKRTNYATLISKLSHCFYGQFDACREKPAKPVDTFVLNEWEQYRIL